MDDPGFMVEDIKPGIEGRIVFEMIKFGRQAQVARFEFGAEQVNDGITPLLFEGFMGEIGVWDPGLMIWREAAGSGGQVNMGVAFKIATEGVRGQIDSGHELLFGGPLFNDVGG